MEPLISVKQKKKVYSRTFALDATTPPCQGIQGAVLLVQVPCGHPSVGPGILLQVLRIVCQEQSLGPAAVEDTGRDQAQEARLEQTEIVMSVWEKGTRWTRGRHTWATSAGVPWA